MSYYRLYRLAGPRNEVVSFHEFEEDDDERAIALVETMRQVHALELWQGHRKVRRWESVSHPSSVEI